VKLLLDTHLLLWTASTPERLSPQARELIEDPGHQVAFSVVSIWETSIKFSLQRKDLGFEPAAFRRKLLAAGFEEIPVRSSHAIAVAAIPLLHRDPFDRTLLAQARVEVALLLTSDRQLQLFGCNSAGLNPPRYAARRFTPARARAIRPLPTPPSTASRLARSASRSCK
jgi:PIN domain nuclease of toxin-antitoxin system